MGTVAAQPPMTRTSPWRSITCMVLSAAGFGLSIYLTYLHYEPHALSCPLGGKGSVVDCQAVLTSTQSVLFAIPIPFYGLAFFVLMFAVNLPAAWRSTSRWVAWARVAAAIVGMVMVIYLISQEALALHKLCVWCTSVHIVTFAIFVLVLTGWNDTGWAQLLWDDDEGE